METFYDLSAPWQQSLTDGLPPAITDLFTQELVSPEEFPCHLTHILQAAVHHLQVEYGSLYWFDRQANALVLGAEYSHRAASSSAVAVQSLAYDDKSIIARVAQTKDVVTLADLNSTRSPWQYHRRKAWPTGHAALAVPLLAHDGERKILVGVLSIDGSALRVVTAQVQQFLENLARYIQRGVRHAKFSAAMQTIGTKMLTMDQQALLDYTVKVLADDLLYVPVCSIWLIDQVTGKLVLESTIGRPKIDATGKRVVFERNGFIGKAVVTCKPVYSPDVRQDESFLNRPMAVEEGWVSGFALPILSAHGEPLGVINPVAKEARDFGKQYERIMTFLAQQVAIALQQGALLRRVSSLQGISEALVTTTRLDDLLQRIVDQATQLLEGAGGIVYLHDTRSDTLVAEASCGIATASQGTAATLDASLVGWVSQDNTPVRCLASDPHLDPDLAVLIGDGSVVAVPLGTQHRSLGTLCVLNKRGGTVAFDDSDLALLQTFASHATIAITKTRQEQRLRMLNRIFEESAVPCDIDTLLSKATDWIHQAFGYGISIGILAPKHLIVTIVDYNGGTRPLTIPLSQGIMGRVARTGEGVMVRDVQEEAPSCYVSCSPDTRAALAVPLRGSKSAPLGVLNIESQQRNAFLPEDRDIFLAIAAGVARAIENACQRIRLNVLHDLSTAVGKAQNLQEVFSALLRTVTAHFHVNAAAIYLWDAPTQQLSLVEAQGLLCLEQVQMTGGDILQNTVEHVFQTETFEVVEDVTTQPDRDAMPSVTDTHHALAAVPISTDKEVLGVLAVAAETMRSFPTYAMDLLMEIGKSIGVEIEKARLHQRLAEAEDKYRRLFQGALDPFLILDQAGTILDANAGLTQVSQYTKEELLGQKVPTFLATRAEQKAKIPDRLNRAMSGKTVEPREFEMRRKDGSLFIVESNLTPIVNNTGQVTAIHAMWRDVTTRKAHEDALHRQNKHLSALLDICRQAFRSLERDDLLPQAAARARTLVESDDCTIFLRNGDPTSLKVTFSSTPQRPEDNEIIGNIIQQVAQLRSGEIRNYIDAHYNAFQHLLAVPLQSEDTVLGVLSVMRHVHQNRRPYTPEDRACLKGLADVLTLALEYQRLAEAQHKQQTAARALEQVSLVGAFLGHKLGGFLGSLSLTTELLARQVRPGNPSAASLLDNLLAQGRTASRFAEGFRNMAKPLNAPPEVCSMGSLVHRALQRVRSAGIPGNARVEVPQESLPSVQANQALLLEVVDCLIRNAIEAMPNGGTLAIQGSTTMVHDHQELRLQFSDTGHGIPQDVLKDLFTPFFTTKQDGHSLGIGLWLARLYLQTLRGDIEATSKVGNGSTFTLRLPVAQDTGGQAEKMTERVASQMGWPGRVQRDRPGQANVLIVEDEPDWQRLLSAMLLDHNVQAQVAQGRAEAQKYLRQQAFDAFIVDVRLVSHKADNCDGLNIAAQILTQHADASVLILSGWSAQLVQARSFMGQKANVRVADKTKPREVKKAIEAFCRHLRHKTPSHTVHPTGG